MKGGGRDLGTGWYFPRPGAGVYTLREQRVVESPLGNVGRVGLISSRSFSCSSTGNESASGGQETEEDGERGCLQLCSLEGFGKCALYIAQYGPMRGLVRGVASMGIHTRSLIRSQFPSSEDMQRMLFGYVPNIRMGRSIPHPLPHWGRVSSAVPLEKRREMESSCMSSSNSGMSDTIRSFG